MNTIFPTLPHTATLASVTETHAFAEILANSRAPGDVIALCGALGAGKTTLVQGFAHALGVPPHTAVNSPTYQLLNIYYGRLPIFHFDWYRLDDARAITTLDLEEYFDGDGVTIVEWADKFPHALPERTLWIRLTPEPDHTRTIVISRECV